MSDSSAFIAGCATTGAAALILLVARITVSKSPPVVEDLSTVAIEEIAPVPTSLSLESGSAQFQDLLEEIEKQEQLNERLEGKIAEQDLLLQDLQAQIQWQQQESQALIARINTHEATINTLTTQQQQFAGVQQETDRTQSSLLWVGAGLVMVVLIGGAVVMVILVVLVAFQSRNRQSPSSQVVYSTEVPVAPHPSYYQGQFLPAPRRPRQVYPQDIYDQE